MILRLLVVALLLWAAMRTGFIPFDFGQMADWALDHFQVGADEPLTRRSNRP